MSDVPPVEQALSLLSTLAERDTGEQVEIFATVHRLLQDALATLDGV